MKFSQYGFKRTTHKDGKFDKENANIWQAHIWNRTVAKDIGALIPTGKGISFENFIKECKKKLKDDMLDDEEIAKCLIELISCGLICVEKIEDYETDVYDEGVKFWKK